MPHVQYIILSCVFLMWHRSLVLLQTLVSFFYKKYNPLVLAGPIVAMYKDCIFQPLFQLNVGIRLGYGQWNVWCIVRVSLD